jgi:nitrate/nitrite transport system permease protein
LDGEQALHHRAFAKRGELDQGILRFTWMSLVLVAQGYFIALVIGTPIGFFLGLSKSVHESI